MADDDFRDKNGKVDVERLLASLTDAQRNAIAAVIRSTPISEDWVSDGDGGSMRVDDATETLNEAAGIFRASSSDWIFEN
jgi:hypothetical protein